MRRYDCLRGDLAHTEDAAGRVERALPRVKAALAGIAAIAAEMQAFLGADAMAWEDMLQLGAFCRVIQPITEAGRLSILDAGHPSAEKLVAALQKVSKLEAAAAACEATSGWPKDIDIPNLAGLIAAAKKHEGRFFAFLSGDWRRAKRAVRTHYKGKSSSVATALLQSRRCSAWPPTLNGRAPAWRRSAALRSLPRSVLRWSAPGRGSELKDVERDAVRVCLTDRGRRQGAATRHSIGGAAAGGGGAWRHLSGYARLTQGAIAASVEELENNTGQIAEFASLLNELDKTDVKIAQTLRALDMPLEQIEVAVLDSAINAVFRRNRALDRFEAPSSKRSSRI